MQGFENQLPNSNVAAFRRTRERFSFRHLALTALSLYLISIASVLFNANSRSAGSIGSFLWVPTGLLIGITLCRPRKHWPAYIAAGFLVDFTTSFTVSSTHPVYGAIYLAGCNVIQAALALWLLDAAIVRKEGMSHSGQMIRLLAYGVFLTPAVASFAAAWHLAGWSRGRFFSAFLSWFTCGCLGNAIVIPLCLRLHRRVPFPDRRLTEILSLFALLCTVTLFVFWQTSVPLLYLVLPVLLLVEVRLGLAGSTLGLLIVSLIGGFCTARDRGPVALARFHTLSDRTLMLQLFIFICMLVLYIVEVVITERNHLEANLRASEQRFRMLAEGTHDVILLQNLQRRRQYVSPAVQKLSGWTPEEYMQLTPHDLIHPEDLPRVDEMYERCRTGRPVNTMEYRWKKKDGSYLWIEGNLVLHHHPETGEPEGFINVIRNISNRKAEEARLHQALDEAEELASSDSLTGVANRRRFDEHLHGEWLRAIRAGTPTSILMLDVDYFKQYNDRYGHLAGDECLKEIATIIGSCIRRQTDLEARFGGEEFAVVLPNTDLVGALYIGEQIRQAVQERHIPHEGNTWEVVTVSIGCATAVPQRGSLCTELIESADRALYDAKSSGRNRVRLAETEVPELLLQ